MAMQALAVASLLLILWPARRAGAAEYVVGDVSYGWESGSGINYAAWARQYALAVGDVLRSARSPPGPCSAHHINASLHDPCI